MPSKQNIAIAIINPFDLVTLINKCLGSGSYSKEGLESKIKGISDGGFFD